MDVSISYGLDSAQLLDFLRGESGPVWQFLMQKGNQLLNDARSRCPVDEGRLRGSLTLEMSVENGVPVAKVGSNLEYAIYVHEGTGIYAGRGPIFPKNGTVLRWPSKNNSGSGNRRYSGGSTSGYTYARSVKGVKGRPFLKDALDALT